VPDNFRTLVVVNPKSAGGTVEKKWTEIARTIADNFGPFEHRHTKAPGDAARVAREGIAEGFELIVALGGDGTISEVANGFFEDGKAIGNAALGVLPFGTGGDFRKTMLISKELAASARALRGRKTRMIDCGRLDLNRPGGGRETRYFVNIASFGIAGLVDELVNTSSKALGGRASFLIATLRAQLSYQNQRVRLVLDDGEPEEMLINNVAVSNGQYFGGGMHIAPNAEVDDGLFDVVTLGDFSPLELVLHGMRIYKGTHLTLPKVKVRRAAKVEAWPVTPGDEVRLDVDGETPGALPALFTCLPQVLPFKVNES